MRVERTVEVDVERRDRVRKRDAVAIDELPQLVLVGHRPRCGRRAEQRPAEACTLLVGPVDEPHRDGRRPVLGDPAEDLPPASTLRQPSSQPPFGTESMWPPISTARSDAPRSEYQSFPAASRSTSSGRSPSESASQARPFAHVSVHATRCSPFRPPSMPELAQAGDDARRIERHAREPTPRRVRLAKRFGRRCGTEYRVLGVVKRVAIGVAVLGGLCAFYSAYRWLWMTTGWTWPFIVDDITMPSLPSIVERMFESNQPGGPLLIEVLLDAAWFTAKEAAAGFALGRVDRARRRDGAPPLARPAPRVAAVRRRLADGAHPRDRADGRDLARRKGLPIWVPVAVIAAYLTFFPVTINTLRGLDSAQPRALELMRSYAAGSWSTLWKVKYPSSLPFVFSALKVAATASVVGAIIGELPSGIQDGLGGAILNFNQYYSIDPQALWATNIVAAGLGIVFFCAVVIAEKLVVRAAPEHVA